MRGVSSCSQSLADLRHLALEQPAVDRLGGATVRRVAADAIFVGLAGPLGCLSCLASLASPARLIGLACNGSWDLPFPLLYLFFLLYFPPLPSSSLFSRSRHENPDRVGVEQLPEARVPD